MSTAQLLIVCLTVLAALVVVAVAVHRVVSEIGLVRRAVAREDYAARRLEATAAREDAQAKAADATAPSLLGHRVTVHTKDPDDRTFYGVVVGDYADQLCLEDGQFVTPHGAEDLPGRTRIDVPDRSWIDDHGVVAPAPDAPPVTAEA